MGIIDCKKKIALIGSAPSSVKRAPYNHPDWTVFGCSPGAMPHVSRPDLWFEMHGWRPENPCCEANYVRSMQAMPCPIFMVNPVPELPTSVRFPKEEVLGWSYGTMLNHKGEARAARFNPNDFASTLSWMLAYAIMQGPEEIGLWGVDMAACTSPETKVLTADLRWVECQELEVGDKIIAFDEFPVPNGNSIPSRKWRTAEVLEASRLTKPCYRIELEDGRELICSEDHKWLTHAEGAARWCETKDLITSHHRKDRPTRIIKLLDTWSEAESYEAGYLAAAFDGEGHLSQKLREGDYGVLRCGFAQKDNEMLAEVQKAMRARGFDLGVDAANGMYGDCLKHTVKGGRAENMRFLGSTRPKRLLAKFNPEHLGKLQKQVCVAVVSTEYIGHQPVIGLRTSTKTFIAEGFASHNTEEYGVQKDGCLALIHIAKSLGIQVTVPAESDLLRPAPLYGYQEHDHFYIKQTERDRELQARINDVRQRMLAAREEEVYLAGARDQITYDLRTWVADPQAIQMMFTQPDLITDIKNGTYEPKTDDTLCTALLEGEPEPGFKPVKKRGRPKRTVSKIDLAVEARA